MAAQVGDNRGKRMIRVLDTWFALSSASLAVAESDHWCGGYFGLGIRWLVGTVVRETGCQDGGFVVGGSIVSTPPVQTRVPTSPNRRTGWMDALASTCSSAGVERNVNSMNIPPEAPVGRGSAYLVRPCATLPSNKIQVRKGGYLQPVSALRGPNEFGRVYLFAKLVYRDGHLCRCRRGE